jgi:hypothetical protein
VVLGSVATRMWVSGREITSTRTLDNMLNSHRGDSEDVARDAVAYCNAVAIQSIRSGTSIKVGLLLAAGTCQIAAIAALGACAWVVETTHG